MLQVTTGTTNDLIYISRFNNINKFEIYSHENKLLFEEAISLTAYTEGKIYHSGITFDFKPNTLYTYISYYYSNETNKYYVANRSLLRTWYGDERLETYNEIVKPKNKFKTKK